VSRQTNARVKNRDGTELVVQDSHSDSPLLPIAGIERLHNIRPDRVDWVFEQTQIEAEKRREEQHRVNTLLFMETVFAFVEHMFGRLLAFSIGIGGIGRGVYLRMNGHEWLGGTLASLTIGTLAVAFLTKNRNE
jgi:hypothetical protein